MVSVIVLAAGSSRRMGGSNKLLLPWKNSTLIQHAVEVCMESCADKVLVVLGHHSSRIKNALWSCQVQFVVNPLYEQGMLTSIQAGIRGASPESAAERRPASSIILSFGSFPFISSSVLDARIGMEPTLVSPIPIFCMVPVESMFN